MISRDYYLNELLSSMWNGFPKVITGIRRCGKSYLLNEIFRSHLIAKENVRPDDILSISLDSDINAFLRDPIELGNYVRNWAKGKKRSFVMIDEIQKVFTLVNPALTDGKHVLAKDKDKETLGFVDVILGLSKEKNIDLYVTGSNSKMLSSDIITEFRDKATNIHLTPLSVKESYEYQPKDNFSEFVNEYLTYGGMPLAFLEKDEEKKKSYLKSLFTTTYFKDIMEHNNLRKSETLDELMNIIGDNVGSLINSKKIASLYYAKKKTKISEETIQSYLDYFVDAYLIQEVRRFDIKGNEEIGALRKYYFTDLGLRNARSNFAYPDYGHLFENLVYNELIRAGYNVNVGVFDVFEKDKNGKTIRKNYEVDFKAVKGNKRLYIQACLDYGDGNKIRERTPFRYLNDSFAKIIVINKDIKECLDDEGNTIIGIKEFLLRYL